MGRKLDGRSISIHRSYPVKDIANALGVHKGTVLRWIRHGALTPIDKGRPILVQGRTIRAFLAQRCSRKRPCQFDEWYCFKCRAPRRAAFQEGEIIGANGRTCNIRALCETCATVMHKRFAICSLQALGQTVRLSNGERVKHLIK